MNVNLYNTTDYENKWQRRVRKNEPNTNPIKPNLRKAKMNVNSLITKDYRKKDDFTVRKNKPNSNPISEKPKMNVNLYVIKGYENETAFRLEQNKPNQTQSPESLLKMQIPFCGCLTGLLDVPLSMSAFARRGTRINPALRRFPSSSSLRNNTGQQSAVRPVSVPW